MLFSDYTTNGRNLQQKVKNDEKALSDHGSGGAPRECPVRRASRTGSAHARACPAGRRRLLPAPHGRGHLFRRCDEARNAGRVFRSPCGRGRDRPALRRDRGHRGQNESRGGRRQCGRDGERHAAVSCKADPKGRIRLLGTRHARPEEGTRQARTRNVRSRTAGRRIRAQQGDGGKPCAGHGPQRKAARRDRAAFGHHRSLLRQRQPPCPARQKLLLRETSRRRSFRSFRLRRPPLPIFSCLHSAHAFSSCGRNAP